MILGPSCDGAGATEDDAQDEADYEGAPRKRLVPCAGIEKGDGRREGNWESLQS